MYSIIVCPYISCISILENQSFFKIFIRQLLFALLFEI